MTSLINRIDAYLAAATPAPQPPARPAEVAEGLVTDLAEVPPEADADAAFIKSCLSGVFAEAIEVFMGTGEDAGAYLVQVPLAHLKASGLRRVESVVKPRVGSRDRGLYAEAIVGSPQAVENAENRIAKPLGEGWRVKLDSFPAHKDAPEALYFRVSKAT